MKTVKRVLSLIVAVALMASCSESEQDPKSSTEIEYQTLDLNATLSGQPVKMVEGSTVVFTGSSNCNLSDNTCVALSGVVRNLQNGNYQIKNGTLRIMSETTGCYLIGEFQGWGKNFINDMNLSALINVNCGTGVFEADGGELDLKITQMDVNGNFAAEIHGFIEREKQLVPQGQ